MPFQCKSCQKTVTDAKKPSQCPHCYKKNPGWDIVAAPATTTVAVAQLEWETFAAEVKNSDSPYTDANSIANQNGLPDLDCLVALLNAISMPATPTSKKIAFTISHATYGGEPKKALHKAQLIANTSFFSKGNGASICAEAAMWDEIKGSATKPYLIVGQTVAPCDLCCSRYRGLAMSKTKTIVLGYAKGYDKRPNNGTLIFTSTGTIYTSKAKNP